MSICGVWRKSTARRDSVLGPLDLDDPEGDRHLFVIVGPSGSGKSTLLRLIAGLETLTAGTLWIDGRPGRRLPPRDRDVAMVFQTPVLYPYLSVFENLAFGLRAGRVARAEIERRVAEAAAVLGLGDCLDRRPETLSGGQRQRVRAGPCPGPAAAAFLLLDEPFSSLDPPLRAAIRAELIDLHRELGTTMIHVTHDQAEALAIGDPDRGPGPRAGSSRPALRWRSTSIRPAGSWRGSSGVLR